MSKLILSLDGGGIRGAATSQFLTHVEESLKNNHATELRDCVDFYAGTSTGSIIALALATTDMSLADINKLYAVDSAKKIFEENRGLFEIDGINAPKYEAKGKTDLLRKELKKAKLGDVPEDKEVLAVSYGVERRKPVIFKSTDQTHRELYSADVADASSAAPTFFPTKELEMEDVVNNFWLVDGGVIANNPTMCAIAEARRRWKENSIDELNVLSIGTGYRTRTINGRASRKWGGLQWMTKGNLIDLLADERVVAYQAKTIITAGNYIRVNAELKESDWLPHPPKDEMDDISASNIAKLKNLGDYWFKEYGDAVIELLRDVYNGPSLDRIDSKTGKPTIVD